MAVSTRLQSRYFVSFALFLAAATLVVVPVEAAGTVGFGKLKVTVKDTNGVPIPEAMIQLIQFEYAKAGGGGGLGKRTSGPGSNGCILMAPDITQVEELDPNQEKVRQSKKTGADGVASFDKVATGVYRVALLRNGKIHQSQRGKVEADKSVELSFEQQAIKPATPK